MLTTLSEQERRAIQQYEDDMRMGVSGNMPAWADGFMQVTLHGFRPEEEMLDVGCGMGRAIEALETLGVRRYLGIDPSEERVKYCRLRYPNHKFEVDEIRTLGEHYPHRFSGFWLAAVLMHLPRPDLVIAMKSLRASLKTDAIGFFATPMGVPGKLENENLSGVRHTLYTMNEIEYAFAANNFKIGSIFESGGMIVGNAVTF